MPASLLTLAAMALFAAFVATPAAFAVVIVAASAATGGSAGSARPDEVTELFTEKLDEAPAAEGEKPPPIRNPAAPRVAFYGDSTAVQLSVGFDRWSRDRESWRSGWGVSELGCGLMREGVYRFRKRWGNRPRRCQDRETSWAKSVEFFQPDVAVVSFGPWEVADRELPGQVVVRALGDPILDAYLREEMLTAVDILSARGALVVWLTHPAIQVRGLKTNKLPEVAFPESNPARMARFNQLVFELAELRPERVRVVDLAGYMRTLPGGELDADYRPDGIHLTPEMSAKLAADWLAGEILRVYRDRPIPATSERKLEPDRSAARFSSRLRRDSRIRGVSPATGAYPPGMSVQTRSTSPVVGLMATLRNRALRPLSKTTRTIHSSSTREAERNR